MPVAPTVVVSATMEANHDRTLVGRANLCRATHHWQRILGLILLFSFSSGSATAVCCMCVPFKVVFLVDSFFLRGWGYNDNQAPDLLPLDR